MCSDSHVGNGTSDDCTVVVAVVAASADNVSRRGAVDLCLCLFCTDSLDCYVDVHAILARVILADDSHIDAVAVVDDVFAVAVHMELSDEDSARFASPLLHDEHSSFHSKSSIQFLRSSRDDL